MPQETGQGQKSWDSNSSPQARWQALFSVEPSRWTPLFVYAFSTPPSVPSIYLAQVLPLVCESFWKLYQRLLSQMQPLPQLESSGHFYRQFLKIPWCCVSPSNLDPVRVSSPPIQFVPFYIHISPTAVSSFKRKPCHGGSDIEPSPVWPVGTAAGC